jgi:putative Ca2+/H+ antiporter (TMEM165/GDT1 family)
MESFLLAMLVAALAEIGDKTQVPALVLAARFRRPGTIVTGVLLASRKSQPGRFIRFHASTMRWVLAGSLLVLTTWKMLAGAARGEEKAAPRIGLFSTALVGCFLAEMCDKTQLVTAALSPPYSAPCGWP